MKKILSKPLALMLAIATIGSLSACSTTMSPETRTAYDQTQKMLQGQSVGIISDGCLVRVELGKDDILYQQSEIASTALAQNVKTRLTEKGVQVNNVLSPFVCGEIPKEKLTKLDILTTAHAKDTPNTAYPLLSSSNSYDATTNQALLQLFKAVDGSTQTAKNAKGTHTPLSLDQASRNTIKQAVNTNKVFVAMASGSKPSFGASMTVGAVTALASGGTYVSSLQKGQFYSIYLVNLDSNQVEWYKSGRLPGQPFKSTAPQVYDEADLLVPLYAK